MSAEIVNRVATSGLFTLEVDQFIPEDLAIISFDLKPFLWEEMVLRERDFREALSKHDWDSYSGKTVAVFCSNDALIPHWAYMLVSAALTPFAAELHFASPEVVREKLIEARLNAYNWDSLKDQRVVVKGCGKGEAGYAVYGKIAQFLSVRAKSILFGEPCSTVPIFKKALK